MFNPHKQIDPNSQIILLYSEETSYGTDGVTHCIKDGIIQIATDTKANTPIGAFNQDKFKKIVDVELENSIHLTKTSVGATDPKQPTIAEIEASTTQFRGFAYYNNSDNPAIESTHLYMFTKTNGTRQAILIEHTYRSGLMFDLQKGGTNRDIGSVWSGSELSKIGEVLSLDGTTSVSVKSHQKGVSVKGTDCILRFSSASLDIGYSCLVVTGETSKVTLTSDMQLLNPDFTPLDNGNEVIQKSKVIRFSIVDGGGAKKAIVEIVTPETKPSTGLRLSSVTDATVLSALIAEDYNRIKVTALSKEYVFVLGGTYDALRGDIKDDADTGIWIPTTPDTSQSVDFDFQLGNIIHAIPDSSKAIYEINGQTVTDPKLAEYITDNPIAGFGVTGDDIAFPDWRGRYIGGSGGRAISATVGSTMGSTNKHHKHYVWTDWHGRSGTPQTGTILGETNANTNNSHEGTPPTTYEGSTYARPETVGIPICIIGGRSMQFTTDKELIPVKDAIEDEVHTLAQNVDMGVVTVSFTANPDKLTFYGHGQMEQLAQNTISFKDLKDSGTLRLTLTGRNNSLESDTDSSEIFHLIYEVKYIDDSHITVQVLVCGYSEKNNNFVNRNSNATNYYLKKVVVSYRSTKTISNLIPKTWSNISQSNAGLTDSRGMIPIKHPIHNTDLSEITFNVGDRRKGYTDRKGAFIISLAEILAVTPNDGDWRRIDKTISLGGANYPFRLYFRYTSMGDDLGFSIHDDHGGKVDTYGEVTKISGLY